MVGEFLETVQDVLKQNPKAREVGHTVQVMARTNEGLKVVKHTITQEDLEAFKKGYE